MQVTSNPDKWSAIVNSFAASSKAASLWRRAEDRLRSDGIYFETYFTGESGNATTLAYNACSSGCRKLLAVGGDGTVHDVLGGIMAFVNQDTSATLEDFTLAVIPVGSGNDWIKTAGVPKDIVEAAALLKNGTVSKQDVVKVSLLLAVPVLLLLGASLLWVTRPVRPRTALTSSLSSAETASKEEMK